MPEHDPRWSHTFERKRAVSEDGTRISYEVLGEGRRVVLLANGLGGRLYAWEPLIAGLWRDYRIITWDYRGLYDSGKPSSPRRLAIGNHVEDAIAILKAEHSGRATLIGWSMGVQVSLDVAATHPELVAGLVLLNGTHGHAFSSGFQPFMSVPWLPKRLHWLSEWIRNHPHVASKIATAARLTEIPTAAALTITAGRRSFAMRPLLRRYMDDVLGESFENFMRLFQELDAHSVYHLLPEILAPALVISGALDYLTPAYQSREIARRLPASEHLALLRSSHFSLLERPEIVVPRIRDFLTIRARWD